MCSARWAMNVDRFFLGFMASLVLQNVDAIRTEEDEHHVRFGALQRWLNRARSNGFSGVLLPSVLFTRSPISGRFGAWESALLRYSAGWAGSKTTVYPSVRLVLNNGEAQSVLGGYSERERAFLAAVATRFIQARVSQSIPVR
jgi:hypothetical protein